MSEPALGRGDANRATIGDQSCSCQKRYERDVGNGAMVDLLRHRQTKGTATDRFYLTPPRHISARPPLGETEVNSGHLQTDLSK